MRLKAKLYADLIAQGNGISRALRSLQKAAKQGTDCELLQRIRFELINKLPKP